MSAVHVEGNKILAVAQLYSHIPVKVSIAVQCWHDQYKVIHHLKKNQKKLHPTQKQAGLEDLKSN